MDFPSLSLCLNEGTSFDGVIVCQSITWSKYFFCCISVKLFKSCDLQIREVLLLVNSLHPLRESNAGAAFVFGNFTS